MRLFAAVPLPVAAVERLTRLRLRLSAPKDGLRWSEPEQWHITLQFYGEVDEKMATCLASQFGQLTAGMPEMVLERLDLFVSKGILLATVSPTPSLVALQAQVLEASQLCGIVPESRPFRPHITLARSRGKTGHGTLRDLSTPALPGFGPEIRWTARECLLMESELTQQGAQYVVRARVALPNTSSRSQEVMA